MIPSRSPNGAQDALFAAAVVLVPALLLWHLHAQWNPDGEYAYGWAVPLLVTYLFKSRWDDRPPPSASVKEALSFVLFFALLTLPCRWLQEAAPERSICAWSYGFAAVGISLALISLVGGLAWLRWFSFPFTFILTAVPWPHALETFVSNSLMQRTAGVTVEILCLIGIPSTQSGNLVHIETGVIDIAEACSGIRSLQAMVMISLFLGELFRLKPARRLLLVALGLAVTLFANVVRTVALSSIGFDQGMSAVDRYHDAAGFAVLALSLSSTLALAFRLRPSEPPTQMPNTLGINTALPLKLSFALLIWFAAEEVSVEAWYRAHEPKWNGWSWAVQWPQHNDSFQFFEMPKRSLQILRCDESRAASWKEHGEGDWSLYWICWNPGNTAAESAKVHRPDVCFPAEGAIMEKDTGTQLIPVGGMRIPFHSYTFLSGEKTLYVFFCLYEERPGAPALASNPTFEGVDMFQRALEGRRHLGQQSLEAALSGYGSEKDAQDAFTARLGQLIQVRRSNSISPLTKD